MINNSNYPYAQKISEKFKGVYSCAIVSSEEIFTIAESCSNPKISIEKASKEYDKVLMIYEKINRDAKNKILCAIGSLNKREKIKNLNELLK